MGCETSTSVLHLDPPHHDHRIIECLRLEGTHKYHRDVQFFVLGHRAAHDWLLCCYQGYTGRQVPLPKWDVGPGSCTHALGQNRVSRTRRRRSREQKGVGSTQEIKAAGKELEYKLVGNNPQQRAREERQRESKIIPKGNGRWKEQIFQREKSILVTYSTISQVGWLVPGTKLSLPDARCKWAKVTAKRQRCKNDIGF